VVVGDEVVEDKFDERFHSEMMMMPQSISTNVLEYVISINAQNREERYLSIRM